MFERPGARLALVLACVASGMVAPAAAFAQAPGQEPGQVIGNCVTSACHGDLVAGAHKHEAAESCDNCHVAKGGPHPVPGERTFELASNPPALCAECHDSAPTKSHVHPPFARGTCTICHNPHSSDQPKLLRRTVADLCRHCHANPAEVAFPHGPVSSGDCLLCHAPHESANLKLLVKSQDELCFDCHSEIKDQLGRKTVHGAIDAGCTECHSPHGAKHPKLLERVGAELCADCHSEVTDKIASAAKVHPPVADAKACSNCHAPHGADHAKLLVKSTGELCKSCHSKVVTAEMTYEHAPVADGDCTACHDPHASPSPKLLARAFPSGHYAAYDEKSFALCFECHDAALARFPDTSFATEFRDGNRNLHYLHVNKSEKGRSCVLCHAVHGSPNPRLIATSVKFGDWSLPLGFVKTETGGSCAPGCHRPQSYDRKTPVGAPAPAEPQKSGAR